MSFLVIVWVSASRTTLMIGFLQISRGSFFFGFGQSQFFVVVCCPKELNPCELTPVKFAVGVTELVPATRRELVPVLDLVRERVAPGRNACSSKLCALCTFTRTALRVDVGVAVLVEVGV